MNTSWNNHRAAFLQKSEEIVQRYDSNKFVAIADSEVVDTITISSFDDSSTGNDFTKDSNDVKNYAEHNKTDTIESINTQNDGSVASTGNYIVDDTSKSHSKNVSNSDENDYENAAANHDFSYSTNFDSRLSIGISNVRTKLGQNVNDQAFWWDYLELQKREDELEARLCLADERICKVKKILLL